jgi:predicted negative regulator of RcsB-dependent stress response
MTEQEQIQAAKKWLSENGLPILLAVVVGGGGYFGWKAYQASQQAKIDDSSDLYQEFVVTTAPIVAGSLVSADRLATAKSIRDNLVEEYNDSLYPVFASAELARIELAGNDADSALADLRLAYDISKDEGIRAILKLRIAKVLQEMGDLDGALAELEGADPAFAALYARQRGSIYQQQGQNEAAIAAYQEAAAEIALTDPNFANLLQMQIEHLQAKID